MKTLLADDHLVVREGLKQIISKLGLAGFIEEAEDGNETLHKINRKNSNWP